MVRNPPRLIKSKVIYRFRRSQSLLQNLGKLIRLVFKEAPLLTVFYLSTAVIGALFLFVVYFVYKLLIDQVALTLNGSFTTTLFLILITYLLFEYLSRFVTYTFNNYYFDYLIRIRLQNVLTRRFMQKLADLDFSQLESGPVRNLIAQVESTYHSRIPDILAKLNNLVFNIAAIIFSFLIALRFSVVYFLILGLISLPIYYLRAKYGNVAWSSYTSNAPQANYLSYLRLLFIEFQTLTEIKIYGLKKYFLKQTHQIQKQLLDDYERPIRMYSLLSTISFILIPVAIYFSLNRFITQMPARNFTIGDFTFFLNALFTFSGQISGTLVNAGSIYENSLYLNDFFRLIETKNLIIPRKPIHPLPQKIPREIRFDHVSFSYEGSNNLCLKNVSFSIKPGENVALVGHNGAGKTTVTKLLLRFYDPTQGRILVDGINLKHIPINDWYQYLGVLFQDFARYHFSLEQNILLGNVRHPQTDVSYLHQNIHQAFMNAEGKDLLGFLNNDYHQILGRWFGGIELSGGQWQKVAIGRALFRQAPILILDEPTSAIDAESEAEIFNNLKQIYAHQNLFFISHRFSTVRNADKILVLEKGRLVEQGTHQQLIQNQALYAHFFNLQRQGYS